MVSHALESVRNQYEKYPYPAYEEEDIRTAVNWLEKLGLNSDTVIDVGCGTGLWSIAFARRGARVTSVDFSRASLAIATRMAMKSGVSIDFRPADLFGVQVPEKYGIVFCNGVLHHTGNPRLGFHRIASFVKPGGELVTSFYNSLSPFRIAKFLVRSLGGESIEGKKRSAEALLTLPFLEAVLSLMGRWQPGPISSVQGYVASDENLVDLLCHAHTSYFTVWEVKRWYHEEGFHSVDTFPKASVSTVLIPNLIFYFGRL